MSNITPARKALVTRILEGEGTASAPQRRAAFSNAAFAHDTSPGTIRVLSTAWMGRCSPCSSRTR